MKAVLKFRPFGLNALMTNVISGDQHDFINKHIPVIESSNT